jgi:hypothetical protein
MPTPPKSCEGTEEKFGKVEETYKSSGSIDSIFIASSGVQKYFVFLAGGSTRNLISVSLNFRVVSMELGSFS